MGPVALSASSPLVYFLMKTPGFSVVVPQTSLRGVVLLIEKKGLCNSPELVKVLTTMEPVRFCELALRDVLGASIAPNHCFWKVSDVAWCRFQMIRVELVSTELPMLA